MKAQIEKLSSGKYVVFNGYNQYGRRLEAFSTYNASVAYKELAIRNTKDSWGEFKH